MKLHKALESEIVGSLDCLFLFSRTCPAAKAESPTSPSGDFALIFLAVNSLPRLHSPSGSLLICQPVRRHSRVWSLWIKIKLSWRCRWFSLLCMLLFSGQTSEDRLVFLVWMTTVNLDTVAADLLVCAVDQLQLLSLCSADVRLHHRHWGVCHTKPKSSFWHPSFIFWIISPFFSKGVLSWCHLIFSTLCVWWFKKKR